LGGSKPTAQKDSRCCYALWVDRIDVAMPFGWIEAHSTKR